MTSDKGSHPALAPIQTCIKTMRGGGMGSGGGVGFGGVLWIWRLVIHQNTAQRFILVMEIYHSSNYFVFHRNDCKTEQQKYSYKVFYHECALTCTVHDWPMMLCCSGFQFCETPPHCVTRLASFKLISSLRFFMQSYYLNRAFYAEMQERNETKSQWTNNDRNSRHKYISMCWPDRRRNEHAGTPVLHTLLNSHIQRLTKQHNLLLQPKAYNSVPASIYNRAYFLPAKTMHLYLQGTVFIFLNHLWPKNNRQTILLIQVVLLSSQPVYLLQHNSDSVCSHYTSSYQHWLTRFSFFSSKEDASVNFFNHGMNKICIHPAWWLFVSSKCLAPLGCLSSVSLNVCVFFQGLCLPATKCLFLQPF